MKIILISTVASLGKIGDVVEVKNGYAKNFLIPNKQAICFTENNFKIFESKKSEFEQESSNKVDAANAVKDKVIGNNIVIIENASDDGRLYGSVNAPVIAAKINEFVKSNIISRNDITLERPIKDIGVYKVTVTPHSEVSFVVKLIVTRSESEIELLLKAEKTGVKKKASKSDAIFASMEERFAKADADAAEKAAEKAARAAARAEASESIEESEEEVTEEAAA